MAAAAAINATAKPNAPPPHTAASRMTLNALSVLSNMSAPPLFNLTPRVLDMKVSLNLTFASDWVTSVPTCEPCLLVLLCLPRA